MSDTSNPSSLRTDGSEPDDALVLSWLLGDLSGNAEAAVARWAALPASCSRLADLRAMAADLKISPGLERQFAVAKVQRNQLYKLSSLISTSAKPAASPLAALDEIATWIGRALVEKVASLVMDSYANPNALAQGFRGTSTERMLKFDAGDLGVVLSIVPVAETPGTGRTFWLQGRTSPENTTTDVVIRNLERDEPVRSTKLDAGYFEIAVPEGVYEVLCITGTTVVRLPDVRVGQQAAG